MKTRIVRLMGLGLALLSAMFILSSPTLAKPLAPTSEQPMLVAAPAAATIIKNLCAVATSVTMPDSTSVPIWGFGEIQGSDCIGVQSPGPVIEANVGDTVVINLYNYLPTGNYVSLVFPGQENIMPDNVGVASVLDDPPTYSTTYTLEVQEPGTFLYESGTDNPDPQNPQSATDYTRQVPMGLYGALVVHPATAGQAYGAATSAYDTEQVLVLSELDPDLNADPAGFDMLNYAPTYWLINGQAFSSTVNIPAAADDRVLLRYVNAGLHNHTMSLLGMHQNIVARDAFELVDPVKVVAETIPSGQTLDTIATVPSGAAIGDTFPVYNRQLRLTNGPTFPGGMLTFIEVGPGGPGGPAALNFNDLPPVASYAGAQDIACGSGTEILDGGATLHLTGNCWKQIAFPYEVTANTILEFDFMSTAESEIQGIGFDSDSTFDNPISLFQVFGTQNWGILDYNDYTLGDGWKHYVIPVGSNYTGNMTLLTFANDDDAAPIGDSSFRNVTVYEGTPPPPPPGLIVNGTGYTVESYGGGQDNAGATAADVSLDGTTLTITGNAWKRIPFSYPVTANTVLEFDFRSTAQGEIHGIGFDNDNAIDANRTFQIYGTQTWGIINPSYYPAGAGVDGWKHYSITVGSSYPGVNTTMPYLIFANDHDITIPTAQSEFRNITVH